MLATTSVARASAVGLEALELLEALEALEPLADNKSRGRNVLCSYSNF